MKFTLSMLKQFLETDAPITEIARHLTDVGIEVEEIIDHGEELDQFVVAEIINAEQHPYAHSLKICKVSDGRQEIQIVCGAKNARSGIKVALAPLGSIIPSNNVKIKKSKIRDIESFGMLCSSAELNLGDDDAGIIEMPGNALLGEKIISYFGKDDPVINVSVTPNRGDCFGVYGIARDLAAKGLGKLKKPIIPDFSNEFQSNFTVDVKEKALCSSFFIAEIRNLNNINSPEWLKNILTSIGQKSISAVVDITNYISICYAKPLHAYDKDKIGDSLSLEELGSYGSFLALNDDKYTLSSGDLVVSSGGNIVSLAGIIGGKESGCTETTKNIILESACFDPVTISKSGRKYDIITDARQRFERGIDNNVVKDALLIASKMIIDICGGEFSLVSEYYKQEKPQNVNFKFKTLKEISGIDIAAQNVEIILTNLGFAVISQKDNELLLEVPSWRHDITIEEDVVEEVLRIYGFDNIPEKKIATLFKPNILNQKQKLSSIFKRMLASRGIDEVLTWSFCNSDIIKAFADIDSAMFISNPISQDLDYIRPTIIPNLISMVKNTLNRNVTNQGFFEIGPIFKGHGYEDELLSVAGLRYGGLPQNYLHKNDREIDIYDVKEDLISLIEFGGFNVDNLSVDRSNLPKYYHPGRSASIKLGRNILGFFGEIHPKIAALFDIKGKICIFELYIDKLPSTKHKFGFRNQFKPSLYQSSTRDFAFIVDNNVEVGKMLYSIKSVDKTLIESANIFDIYKGNQIEDGKKSVAFEVVLRDKESTMSESAINNLTKQIIAHISEKFNAVLRS